MATQKPMPNGFVVTDVGGIDLKKQTVTLRGLVGKRVRLVTVTLTEVK